MAVGTTFVVSRTMSSFHLLPFTLAYHPSHRFLSTCGLAHKKRKKTSLAHHLVFSKNFYWSVILWHLYAYMLAAIHHFTAISYITNQKCNWAGVLYLSIGSDSWYYLWVHLNVMEFTTVFPVWTSFCFHIEVGTLKINRTSQKGFLNESKIMYG